MAAGEHPLEVPRGSSPCSLTRHCSLLLRATDIPDITSLRNRYGVRPSEASDVSRASPSGGAFRADETNPDGTSFYPLSSGRLALARTCLGPAEYSGRGERRVHTHVILLSRSQLEQSHWQPLAILEDGMALGRLTFQLEPSASLEKLELGDCYESERHEAIEECLEKLGNPPVDEIVSKLSQKKQVRYEFEGNRIALARCILARMKAEMRCDLSFSTSLEPSAARPFRLILVRPANS